MQVVDLTTNSRVQTNVGRINVHAGVGVDTALKSPVWRTHRTFDVKLHDATFI